MPLFNKKEYTIVEKDGLFVVYEKIESEDSNAPLNDQALVNYLNEQGYNIARRTVAKYREQLYFFS